MIPRELEARILRLSEVEKWPVGTIASQLGLHHSVVERVIARGGLPSPARPRPSKVEAYLELIEETLRRYPSLCASRLYWMCRERSYVGSESHFRRFVARLRPKPAAEAYQRLKTLPGEQAQADWAHFGKVQVARAVRALMAFVLVLSYSRRIYLRFFLDQRTENFLRGHEAAFRKWGGCARVILYDNPKSVVLERVGDAIRFNPLLLEFAGHYRFEARPVAIARGNEKGRVERHIQYARTSFFPARKWTDLDDLNAQAEEWCDTIALERPWPEDRSLSVADAFLREQGLLLPLPETPFPTDERREVAVGKTPYVRFDLNDYSVPHELVRRVLTVVASSTRVRVLDGGRVVAEHARSYSQGEQIEDREHIARLIEEKRRAHKHGGFDRLFRAVPGARDLMSALAERGENLGAATSRLLSLLDEFGAAALERAVAAALEGGSPHYHSVRHILEQERRRRSEPPALPVELPDDPRLKDLFVVPHPLSTYDAIAEAGSAGEDADERT
jgi:transposase